MKQSRIQILTDARGKPTHAVVPYEDYLALTNGDAEDAALSRLADERRNEPTLPDAVVRRLVARENPIKVLREHRGLTQAALAEVIDSSTAYVSQLETGTRRPGRDLLVRLASTLDVDIEILLGSDDDAPKPAIIASRALVRTGKRYVPREPKTGAFKVGGGTRRRRNLPVGDGGTNLGHRFCPSDSPAMRR